MQAMFAVLIVFIMSKAMQRSVIKAKIEEMRLRIYFTRFIGGIEVCCLNFYIRVSTNNAK